jgi:mono/diheme cytochrome c family protein
LQMGRVAIIAAALLIVLLGAGAGAIAWQPAMAPIVPPQRSDFPAAEIVRGAELAAIGDCVVCHTAPDGQPFAGGRGVRTPFGTVYSTNITPDPATGIGRWSLAAFERAMRKGVTRDGSHLYPVLPYPHFIHATDEDLVALYAFQMTRQPVRAPTKRSHLPFPFNWRPLLAGWNLLFLRPGVWQPAPGKDVVWNHGEYLVAAIGHCGACHTPHNQLGAEQSGQNLAGGEAEGWQAPALQHDSTAPHAWSVAELERYLQTGYDMDHGAAAGPMAPVTRQLASVPQADAHAMAVYLASLMTSAAAPASPRQVPHDSAVAAMFAGACGACHAADAPMRQAGAPSLALSTTVNAPTPHNVVNVILFGLPWREGFPGPYMPGFADLLSDEQVVAITAYVRERFSTKPAWPDIPAVVQAARRDGGG